MPASQPFAMLVCSLGISEGGLDQMYLNLFRQMAQARRGKMQIAQMDLAHVRMGS